MPHAGETRGPAVTRLAHICIVADDLAATERFYCSALGFKKAFDFVRQGDVVGFYLEVSEKTYVEVFRHAKTEGQAPGPIGHVCFEVEDLDGIRRALKSHGYDVTEKKLGADQSWQAWTTDPGGVRIEFHQYTARSSQVTGANCAVA